MLRKLFTLRPIIPTRLFSLSVKDRIRLEREARLKRKTDVMPQETIAESQKIRNIGIIAHIDAGKTTVTERMLYYSGVLDEPGEVHHGNTTMDYLKEERERGITIRSACITFSWAGHHINLIDTPGHIDFNAEVERSLRVLDGAVVIFDASKGVETQSELVWQQADDYGIPKQAFINKMDKVGSDLHWSVNSIREKLKIKPLLLQIPEYNNKATGDNENDFTSVVDLIRMQKVTWTDEFGDNVKFDVQPDGSEIHIEAKKRRNELIEQLADYDEVIADKYQNGEYINANDLKSAQRKALHQNSKELSLVMIGSALKNRGIQSLLNGVLEFQPSPIDRIDNTLFISDNQKVSLKNEIGNKKLVGLIFKVINDPNYGQLFYTRIYSGVQNARQEFQNVNRNASEKVSLLMRVQADDYKSVEKISFGDIVAITGLKNSKSGDTILSRGDSRRIMLDQANIPKPVFISSLEMKSPKVLFLISKVFSIK